VIFTNPDMLHHAILPNSKLWQSFFYQLKYIVIDGNVRKKKGFFSLMTFSFVRNTRL
jgi:hypothetical protein